MKAMSKIKKIYQISWITIGCLLVFTACKTDPHTESVDTGYARIKGNTMGTTYSIIYQDEHKVNFKAGVDSLLKAINQEVSTYIPNSDISIFNQKTKKDNTLSADKHPHFIQNLIASQKVFEQTNGTFDPTVMPLVNYWGFGYTEKKAVSNVDSSEIFKILESVGFQKLKITKTFENSYTITKSNPNTQLDFSAIAKGYAVDMVGNFLFSKGIQNYFVEIGGETVCKGKSPRGDLWTLGINTPSKKAQITDIQQIVKLTGKGLATSGNYRNYHTGGAGNIYAHTINPKTGFPEKSNLLSTTVVAENCMIADAFATAFMVMGKDAAIELAKQLTDIEIYLIYGNENGEMDVFYTDGFEVYLSNNQ